MIWACAAPSKSGLGRVIGSGWKPFAARLIASHRVGNFRVAGADSGARGWLILDRPPQRENAPAAENVCGRAAFREDALESCQLRTRLAPCHLCPRRPAKLWETLPRTTLGSPQKRDYETDDGLIRRETRGATAAVAPPAGPIWNTWCGCGRRASCSLPRPWITTRPTTACATCAASVSAAT